MIIAYSAYFQPTGRHHTATRNTGRIAGKDDDTVVETSKETERVVVNCSRQDFKTMLLPQML